MTNAIAHYAFAEVERAARDEFERDTLYKSYSVAYLVIQVMTIVTAAVLAWVLPGSHAMWALAAFIPFVVGEFISSAWLKTQMPRPAVTRKWSFMLPLLLVEIVMFAGLYIRIVRVDEDFSNGLLGGAFIGGATVFVLAPVFLRWQNRRDERRLNAQLED